MSPSAAVDRQAETNGEAHEHRPGTVFAPGDPANPRNFPPWRKWCIVASITLIDLTVSWAASGFSPASEDFVNSFHVRSEVGVLGLSLYVLGLALGPMSLAPLSEYYGRTTLYVLPYGAFLLLLAGTALVQNLAGFLVLRVFSGILASVTIANFGGTIADLWPRDQLGPAMSVFLWAAVCGSPSGFLLMSFVAAARPWRDVFWALLGICGGFWIILVVTLVVFKNETRHSVLLRRRAAPQIREHNASETDLPEEIKQRSLGQLFKITLTRPFRFLATESIVIFAALYNGYLYGISFLLNGAFSLVFGEEGYGFGIIGVGLSFLGFIIGVSLGPIVNIWQERHYQRCIRSIDPPLMNPGSINHDNDTPDADSDTRFRNVPEARLQLGKVGAIFLPISLFWFAWTSPPQYHIHWIVPILGTALFGFSFYTLILMTYIYVEDSYMVFSASALAAVGLVRNLAGAGFPLFGNHLFEKEGYNWAGTILACLALVLAPMPFVLERYGVKLRASSPYARQHMDDLDNGEGDDG